MEKVEDGPRLAGWLHAGRLNASWFRSLARAWQRLEAWRREQNEEGPHGSLRNLTQRAFAGQPRQARDVAQPPGHRGAGTQEMARFRDA